MDPLPRALAKQLVAVVDGVRPRAAQHDPRRLHHLLEGGGIGQVAADDPGQVGQPPGQLVELCLRPAGDRPGAAATRALLPRSGRKVGVAVQVLGGQLPREARRPVA